MTLKKNDFIEIEFTGKTSEGEIFDSNIKSDLKKAKLDIDAKPFSFALGQGMFLKSIDDFLVGKEIGNYNIDLTPEKAFGKRDSNFIQMVPIKVFAEHKTNPVQGAMFNFDGRIGKILSVSGGRVLVDFNNPLAGKEVTYKINVLKKIEDVNEKIKVLNLFLFKKDFKFKLENKKLTLQVDKPLVKFVEMFNDKFKEILDLDIEVKEIKTSSNSDKTP